MSDIVYKIKTFTLPGEEYRIEDIYNNKDCVVTEEIKTPCPKEGIILITLKWEEHVD